MMTVKTHARIVSACIGAFVFGCSVAQASSVSLQSSQTTSRFGSNVTLTATVTPSSATGTITFFDGVSILGYRRISTGAARLSTSQLSSGNHSLSARYSGDSSNTSSSSSAIFQTVYPTAATSLWNNGDVVVGANPSASVAADFNGDGIVDLAVLQGGTSGTVTILAGSSNGTFAVNCGGSAQPNCPVVGGNPNAIVAGDFNQDGNTDLAVANGDGSVSLLLGKGDGTFAAAVSVVTGNLPGAFLSIATADFNNDGMLDLAVTDSSNVYVLLGDGTGNFSHNGVYSGELTAVRSVETADFNNDGIPDLAFLAVGDGGDSIQFLFGAGDGTFPA